jgi:hypothetical protein
MEQIEEVTLREHLEALIRHERELREQGIEAADKALELLSESNATHFESLNGEAGRLAKILDASIPREVFENYKDTQATALKIVTETLAEERGARQTTVRLISFGFFILAIATFVLKFIPIGQ